MCLIQLLIVLFVFIVFFYRILLFVFFILLMFFSLFRMFPFSPFPTRQSPPPSSLLWVRRLRLFLSVSKENKEDKDAEGILIFNMNIKQVTSRYIMIKHTDFNVLLIVSTAGWSSSGYPSVSVAPPG